MAAYRITARALERQLVGELVLKEFASLEDLSDEAPPQLVTSNRKFVLVLEEDESPLAGAPQRPK